MVMREANEESGRMMRGMIEFDETFIKYRIFWADLFCWAKSAGLQQVGYATPDFVDSSRSNWLGSGGRPLRTVVWYPAGDGGTTERIDDAIQFASPVVVARDAKMAGRRKYPLVLISHGSRGIIPVLRSEMNGPEN